MRETLQAKGYDLNQVETGRAVIDEELRRFFEKLADNKFVIKGQRGTRSHDTEKEGSG